MEALQRHHSGSQHSSGIRKVRHFSYQSHQRIGKGYSSVVYRGQNDLTSETVAIKAIDMKGVKDAASRQMLDCEIQALTKLKHRNVLKCHDVVRETSHCFIVTDFCNGGDLSALLKKKRKMSERETMKLTRDIVGGFIEIAEGGFLHRDLKLANIFLNDGRAIIADFGFAKKHKGIFERERYNVGSPLYMSPEALKKNIYTVKNDIWSIGIMVFEMLYGQTPWECRTEKELMDKMVRIPVKFRESIKVSNQTKDFIKKCLEVNEQTRMSLDDLKKWYSSSEELSLDDDLCVKKTTSNQDSSVQVLADIGNRMPHRSISEQPNIQNNQSVGSRPSKVNQSVQGQKLPKQVVDRNNTIMMIEINTFRLLFKIYQKVKKYLPLEKQLLNGIGNDVLRRVDALSALLSPQKENMPTGSADLGLAEGEKYLSEDINLPIKKYKTVVKQYYKKYHGEISIRPLGRQVSVKTLLREALSKGEGLREEASEEERVLYMWMLEFANLGSGVTKEHLEGVIEVKNGSPSFSYLRDRIAAV